MFTSTISSSYGRVRASEPTPLAIPRDPVLAAIFAIRANRAADDALSAGRFTLAERLSHAAIEAECRAGVRG